MISLVVAAAENNAIGKDNKLLWHLPDDFRHFKNLTTGHSILMGRKTFESFPKPLPNRRHIVLSRQPNYAPEGADIARDLAQGLSLAKDQNLLFIIGGAQIYKQAMDIADRIDLTRVHAHFNADAFFPDIDPSLWERTKSDFHPKDERHAHDFTIERWERKPLP